MAIFSDSHVRKIYLSWHFLTMKILLCWFISPAARVWFISFLVTYLTTLFAAGVLLNNVVPHANRVKQELRFTLWGWDKMAATLADDIFMCNFANENILILIQISRNIVCKGPIDNISPLLQVMAWCRTGDKPLPETMMAQLNDAYMHHPAGKI